MSNNVCKICRRLDEKLFLKGERCLSPKCTMVRRAYPPGLKPKRKRRGLSDYGKELKEKQRLKNWYVLSEKQLKNYVLATLKKRGKAEDAPAELIQMLESRFDNTVFRLGFAKSRKGARQMITHGYFLINDKPVDIASYRLKKGDIVCLKKTKQGKTLSKNILMSLKNFQPPSWLSLEKSTLSGKVIAKPVLEEAGVPAEISSIFEYYSR